MSEFVDPAYGARSLGDVVPAVAAALGTPLVDQPAVFDLPPAPSYVVFLVDGLGSRLLERHADAAPFLAELAASPLSATGTAGVPSTTVTSLTSLGTALPPGAHGMVGFTSRIPGTDRLLNALSWDNRVDPLRWQPHPTAFTRLQQAGTHVTVVNRHEFRTSGLTRAAHRGADFVGADEVDERIVAATRAAGQRPSLTYVYDSVLDKTGHKFGVASHRWLQALDEIDAEAERLREELPQQTRLLVVADHGMLDCLGGDRIDVDDHPELREGLVLLGGEARFRHLYCAEGARDDVVARWRGVLGKRAEVLTRDDAVGRGWFGPVADAVLPRIGDVVVAARGSVGLFSSTDFAYETSLVGLHGSLTPEEMLIPLLVG